MKKLQHSILPSSIRDLVWHIGSERHQAAPNNMRDGWGTVHADPAVVRATAGHDGIGSGALMWINAMIPLAGKGALVENNATAPLILVRIELAGVAMPAWPLVARRQPSRFPCLLGQHPTER